jgi:hypothetical protein
VDLVEIAACLAAVALFVWFFATTWGEEIPPNDPSVRYDDPDAPTAHGPSVATRGEMRWGELLRLRDALASAKAAAKKRRRAKK